MARPQIPAANGRFVAAIASTSPAAVGQSLGDNKTAESAPREVNPRAHGLDTIVIFFVGFLCGALTCVVLAIALDL